MGKTERDMKIKNIIFDLGGVVIDLDRNRAVEALAALGITDAGTLLGEYGQKGPFLLLETGELTAAGFYDSLISLCRPGTTCTDVQDAFERFLVSLPVERLGAIGRLRRQGYRVYVLSNTNPVMFNHWIDLAFRQEGKTMSDYFDGIVVSYREGMCKPDPQIWRHLMARYGLEPSETLMLDDSAANCASARSLGLEAVQVLKEGPDSVMEIMDRLEKGGGGL